MEGQIVKLIVNSSFFLITLLLTINGNIKQAIYLCLFLLPFDSSVFFMKIINTNGCAIAGLILGTMTSKPEYLRINFYGKYLFSIIILISFSIINIFFLQEDNSALAWDIYFNVKSSSIFFVTSIFLAISFYTILVNFIKDERDLINCMVSLILSVLYFFISFIGSYLYNLNLPIFLQYRISGGDIIAKVSKFRFAGFWADYELTNEFMFIIMGLSLWVLFNTKAEKIHKVISFISIIFSLAMSIGTGTRSFLVMLILFSSIITFVFLSSKNVAFSNKLIIGTIISLFSFFTVIAILNSDILYERTMETMENIDTFQSNQSLSSFETALNRNYSQSYAQILETGGVFGKGAFFVSSLNGDIMVYHCLYYQLIINFGIIGLIIFIVFFCKLIKDLFSNIKFRTQNSIIFALIISLLIDQIKINFFRENSHMLTYWVLFSFITVINKRINWKLQ